MMKKFDRSLLPATPDLRFEMALWTQGCLRIAGADEAGRGALAGPVTAAAVILPPDPALAHTLREVRDSKQMTPEQRQRGAAIILSQALAHAVGLATPQEIDQRGIVPAICLAVRRALDDLPVSPQHLLLDYLDYPEEVPSKTVLVKGDARSLSIAAASVLAKTHRDAWMIAAEEQFPGYGFARHKGYGTAQHLEALKKLGPCPLHRRSFRPRSLQGSADF